MQQPALYLSLRHWTLSCWTGLFRKVAIAGTATSGPTLLTGDFLLQWRRAPSSKEIADLLPPDGGVLGRWH